MTMINLFPNLPLKGVSWAVLFTLVTLTVATMIPFVSAGGFAVSESSWKKSLAFVDFLQLAIVALIFFAVWFLDSPKLVNEGIANASRTNLSVVQFRLCWGYLWSSWFGLYFVFVANSLLSQPLSTNTAIRAFVTAGTNFANNYQSGSMFLMFWIMTRPTFVKGTAEHHLPKPFVTWVCLVLAAFETIVDISPALKGFTESSGVAFGLFSGVAAATCFGLFLGRLESRSLCVPTLIMVAFYFYAAMQPLFPLFRLEDLIKQMVNNNIVNQATLLGIQYVLKALALLLKLGLYLVVRRLLCSGRLAFFMQKVREYDDSVDAEWEGFRKLNGWA